MTMESLLLFFLCMAVLLGPAPNPKSQCLSSQHAPDVCPRLPVGRSRWAISGRMSPPMGPFPGRIKADIKVALRVIAPPADLFHHPLWCL